MIDINDDRLNVSKMKKYEKKVRFRTLGCYPLTGAIESNASNLEEIVLEILKSTTSERQGRVIDMMIMHQWSKKRRKVIFDVFKLGNKKFIREQNQLDTLRFITCGSVDDAKVHCWEECFMRLN